jgi:type I restriction enzyme S subunit
MISEEDIPEHWSLKSLDEITNQIQTGGTPKRSESSFWGSEDDTPWRTSTHFNESEILLEPSDDFVTPSGEEETTIAEPEDVLLVTRVNVGYVAVPDERTGVNQDIKVLRLGKEVTPSYLARYLTHYATELTRKERGAVIKGITTKDVKEIPVPVPPLSEQERIVSVLDDAFESLDRVDDLSTDVSDYTDEFIDAFLHEIFSSDHISEKWPTSLVSEVTEINPQMRLPENKRHPYVPMDAINPETSVIERFDVREEIYSGLSKFKEGDIVVARITPCFENGNIAIVPEIPEGEYAVGSSELVVFRAKNIDPQYLFYYLNSPSVKDWGKRRLSGATGRERVKVSQFRTELAIPVPPIEKQESIVSILDSVTRNTRRTDEDSSRITDYAVELRRSLLQQAFTGQLLRD